MKRYRLCWIVGPTSETPHAQGLFEDFHELEAAAEAGRSVRNLGAIEVEVMDTEPRVGRTYLWEIDKLGRLNPMELWTAETARIARGEEGARQALDSRPDHARDLCVACDRKTEGGAHLCSDCMASRAEDGERRMVAGVTGPSADALDRNTR